MTESSLHQPFTTTARSRVHAAKLTAAVNNPKYGDADRQKLEAAVERYDQWVRDMTEAPGTGLEKLAHRVDLLNDYKRFIELDLIWDGDDLYRSKGQHKIDNALIEEFLPWIVDPDIIEGLNGRPIEARSTSTFAAMNIASSLDEAAEGHPRLEFRRKDQDFAVGRELHLRASFDQDFPTAATENHTIYIGYVAAECKTNLDKTMFQEAVATARDLKIAIPASNYILICEYLDMAPQNHHATDIAEVLILRGARMGAQLRQNFNSKSHRLKEREKFEKWLMANPIRKEPLEILVRVIVDALGAATPTKAAAIQQGHF